MSIELNEDVFKSGRPISQGEVNFWLEKYAPESVLAEIKELENFKPIDYSDNQMIVALSQKGNHHVFVCDRTIEDAVSAIVDGKWMRVTITKPVTLKHLRSNDGHDSYLFMPGDYIANTREEQTVDGWQSVLD